MNSQSALLYVKLGLVGLIVVGIFVLAAMGKVSADVATGGIVTVVAGLAVALGISGGGSAVAAALGSKAAPAPADKAEAKPAEEKPAEKVAS
jgi:hypothetical protein